MINTRQFGNLLKEYGFNFFSGVPSSHLKDLINYAINDCELIMAANEGDAVAVCCGAQLGGKKAVFLCQNSGLTNATSPLTSLVHTFKIPVLGFVSLRGAPGEKDEPQHELMGQITTQMLDLMGIQWEFLSGDQAESEQQLKRANQAIDSGKPFFFVIKKGTFSKEPLVAQRSKDESQKQVVRARDRSASLEMPLRAQALSGLLSVKPPRAVYLATTGFTGRELYELQDADNHFYMVGSMGCVSSLALGLALSRPDLQVFAIDGDGSLLMRMGASATLAAYSPKNLVHILLDNNSHDSTGGQKTVSDRVDFVQFAASMGYGRALYAASVSELVRDVQSLAQAESPTFIYLKTSPGARDDLGRPKETPQTLKDRFVRFLQSNG